MGLIHFLYSIWFFSLGYFWISRQGFIWLWVLIWTVHFSTIVIIVLGWNKRFSDPSLTMFQMGWASLCTVTTLFFLMQAETIFLVLLLVSTMFGSFRLRWKQFMAMALWASCIYGLMLVLKYRFGLTAEPELSLIRWSAFTIAIFFLSWMGSELCQIRRELKIQNHALEQMVHAANTSLEEKQKLQQLFSRSQKMAYLSHVSAGLAHQLNNLLSGVINYPEFLMEEVRHNPEAQAKVLKMKNAGEKIAAIVQDLLNVSLQPVVPKAALDLTTWIMHFQESHAFRQFCARHPQVSFAFELKQERLFIHGNEANLTRAVLQVIENAVAAEPNPQTIKVQCKSMTLHLPTPGYEMVPSGDYVMLSIEDEAPSIHADSLDRLFDPFFSHHKDGAIVGSVVGLGVVWGIIKDHKGYLDVAFGAERGNHFIFYLPRIAEPAQKVEPIKGKHRTTAHILVVDDMELQREIAMLVLEKLGYQVTVARTGQEALGLYDQTKPDLVLLDMIMEEGMDGLDTFKALQAIDPQVNVVITSGYSESERTQACMELGAKSFLKKPYSKQQLEQCMHHALD